jgi:hypothetical protein
MPGQVRHDGQNLSALLNYDKVSKAGVLEITTFWIPVFAGMTKGNITIQIFMVSFCHQSVNHRRDMTPVS